MLPSREVPLRIHRANCSFGGEKQSGTLICKTRLWSGFCPLSIPDAGPNSRRPAWRATCAGRALDLPTTGDLLDGGAKVGPQCESGSLGIAPSGLPCSPRIFVTLLPPALLSRSPRQPDAIAKIYPTPPRSQSMAAARPRATASSARHSLRGL